jgi:hypothetical protein
MPGKQKKRHNEILGPNLDPRWLALFMICASQDGYVSSLLPPNGAVPDYPTTPFTALGLGTDIQEQFFQLFGGNRADSDANRQKFVDVSRMFTQIGNYHPPACPDADTLKSVVDLLNSLQLTIKNTLERYGLES